MTESFKELVRYFLLATDPARAPSKYIINDLELWNKVYCAWAPHKHGTDYSGMNELAVLMMETLNEDIE